MIAPCDGSGDFEQLYQLHCFKSEPDSSVYCLFIISGQDQEVAERGSRQGTADTRINSIINMSRYGIAQCNTDNSAANAASFLSCVHNWAP